MNIQIPYSWIKEFLETNANYKELAKALTLCGPTIKTITKVNGDYLYDIEVTTNRVDMMSVYGIAREAAASLPQFGIKAKLKPLNLVKPINLKKSLPFKVEAKTKLIYRATGIVFENVKILKSPDWLVKRLESAGVRPLSAPVDITNYVMLELGHPMHVFDYDKIDKATIIIRESKKGEQIVSLEDKKYILPGGDIIFQSTKGEIIDLPGIIGTKNSVVSKSTKRFLLFIDNQDPKRIRNTSIKLGVRTMAATINEKGVDPELGMKAIIRGAELFKSITKAKQASNIYDFYFHKNNVNKVKLSKTFLDNRLGISLSKDKIKTILASLKFEVAWKGNILEVLPPSFRARDISIPEDIVEEVARIYGYHKLPSTLMEGATPDNIPDSPFKFEYKTKATLKSLGGVEVYTSSLVSKESVGHNALVLINPLGKDAKYLRTSLMPSLIKVAKENSGIQEPSFVFEIANIYLAKKGKLPQEKMILAGIFINQDYRKAKGFIESLLGELKIDYSFEAEDGKDFKPSQRLIVKTKTKSLGQFGVLESGFQYFEFSMEALRKNHKEITTYQPIPKYPAQIEDITFKIPERTKIGLVLKSIENSSSQIVKVELTDIYENSYTFRIWYRNHKKTLKDEEVNVIRNNIISKTKKLFGVSVSK